MNYFQQYLAEEFAEDYQEGRLSQRQAFDLILSVTGSRPAAKSLLADRQVLAPHLEAGLGGSPSGQGPEVSPDDPTIEAAELQFAGDGATLLGYLALPKGNGPFPVVLVCHENRGLTAYIQDVVRRLAKAGYGALAVDLLSRQGGTSKFGLDQVPGALAGTPPEQFAQDFLSGWRYLQSQVKFQTERVGMVGFCFGGGVTWRVAIAMPELRAAVPFYGPLPPAEEVKSIQAAVLAIYGGNDQRINQGIPPVEEAMRRYGKTFEKVIYPEADHAFHNDTGPRHNPQAARDAWGRTLAWFEKYLV
jgi:carboxymethylenebutenolidase